MAAEATRESAAATSVGMRLLERGWIVVVAAVAFQTLAHLQNAFLLDGRIEGLDADVEGNVFTWASSTAAFAVAVAAVLHLTAFQGRRREFLVVAAIATLFSLDDAVQLHERLGLEVGEDLLGIPDYAAVRLWLVFYLPLLVLLGWVLWSIARDLWAPAGRAVRIGLLLLVSSIPVEIAGLVTRPWEEDGQSAPDDVRVAVEEGLELGGWIAVAVGLTAAVTVALISFRQD